MLNNIKSLYNLKFLLELVLEKCKLKLIIYDNQLKDKLGINLQTYKEKIGKYRIIENNGQGKGTILKTNKILFKGQFLNGSKNGLGAEYDSKTGKLIVQGNYLNGKRSGKGKEYVQNIKCIFEVEYLNEKKMEMVKKLETGKLFLKENINKEKC